jgi:Xaa-Pro aminopeptidase
VAVDRAARADALRSAMAASGVDAVLLSLGSDLTYLTGYEAIPLERLTMLVVPVTGGAVFVVPALEAPRVQPGPFRIEVWTEPADPLAIVAGLLGDTRAVAVGDQTWSSFLLGLQERLPGRRWIAGSGLTSELRIRKQPAEIEALRAAGAAVDRVLARLPSEVCFAERSEAEVARDVIDLTVAEGHDQALFWIVASGPNSASPHHEPGPRRIEVGDLVVVDFGGRKDGYCSDTTRTFSVGEPSAEQREVHEIVRHAQAAGREAVRPGATAESVDRAARAIIEEAGYGEYFIHRTGHGIGLEGHEHPYIIEGNRQVLEAGMTFSIEPGIYLPGRFGVRIEDIVLVTPVGVEELNRAERGLMVVE